jgi:hypothetical protein
VLRFRIFKVDADSPVMVPPAVAAPVHGASRDRDRGPQGARPATVTADTDDASEAVAEPAVDEPVVDEPAAAE